MRPAILGQKLSLIFIPLAFSSLLFALFWKSQIKIERILNPFIGILVLQIGYVLFQVIVLGSEGIIGVLISLNLISFGFITFAIGNYNIARQFAKTLVIICSIFSLSYVITYILFLFGIKIELFTINLTTHTEWIYKLPVMFPFSPVYTAGALVGDTMIPRAVGFFREPGLYQMVLIISYWAVEIFEFRKAKVYKFLLVISLIFTFSTAGYMLLLMTIAWGYFMKSRRKFLFLVSALPLLLGLTYYVVTSQSQFGLARKFDNESGRSRLEATLAAMEIIREKPLMGIGYHNTSNGIELGINFLGTVAQIGLIGVCLFLFPFLYTFIKVRKNHIGFICILLVLLFTMLFSQPLYDKPITYLILSILLLSIENQERTVKNAT